MVIHIREWLLIDLSSPVCKGNYIILKYVSYIPGPYLAINEPY